jgi:DNA-binding transcriptional ArsR family regulator
MQANAANATKATTARSKAALRASVPVFAALGDETRVAVVQRLCSRGPASLAELSEGAGVTRQAITKHLRVLEEAGLVTSSRHGRASLWELRVERLNEAHRALDAIARQWDEALESLRAMVED